MTITNNGTGPGGVTLWSGEYLDTNLNVQDTTSLQTFAIAAPVPEPGTPLLLALGIAGLATAIRARRGRAQ